MRKRIFVLLMAWFAAAPAFAQKTPAFDRRLRLQVAATGNFPVGSFNYRQNEGSGLGQAKTEPGVAGSISLPVYRGFTVGVFASYVHYKTDRNAQQNYLQQEFASDAFYVTYPADLFEFGLTQAGLDFSYNFHLRPIEIEPYLRLLSAGYSDAYTTLNIRRKMKNDNYEEQVSLQYSRAGANFFYPSLGVRAQLPLTDFLYLTGGLQLATGTMRTEQRKTTTDVFGGRKEEISVLRQQVTAFQVSLGLELRIGKKAMFSR